MSSFTDSDGDTYTTELSESGQNIVITYQNGESGGTEMLVLKAADGLILANHIVNTLREWKP